MKIRFAIPKMIKVNSAYAPRFVLHSKLDTFLKSALMVLASPYLFIFLLQFPAWHLNFIEIALFVAIAPAFSFHQNNSIQHRQIMIQMQTHLQMISLICLKTQFCLSSVLWTCFAIREKDRLMSRWFLFGDSIVWVTGLQAFLLFFL